MRNLIQQPDSQWWDDKTTDKVETRDDMFVRAFEEAISQMQDEYGQDTTKWPTWGYVHSSTFRNATLGESGIGPIESLFNRGPYDTGGGKSVVNATGWTVGSSDGFDVNWLPSEREIVDLSNLDASIAIHTTGQSGHAFNQHYDDMAPLWAKVEYAPMWWEQESVIKDSEGHLKLVP